MKSVALHNLGCKVNGYELEVMGQMLQEKGYKIVPFDEKADIYIVNTCTVTNIADRKSRQMLHRAKKKNPDAVVVAAGCYVQAGGEKALQDEGIDLAIGNNRKKDLIPILEEYLENRDGKKADIIDINETDEYESMMLKRAAEHTRAFIKIQDGCNQFCSYCIIPYARGRVRSRKPQEILEEVKELAENGYKEVVLTGIHISSYGLDFDGVKNVGEGEDFPFEHLLSLIQEIHEVEGIKRIRLGSLEPRIITDGFAEGLSALPKFCPHFHLSLQSGSDSVLKRMNRKYTTGEYYDKVCILRKFFDQPAITTDIITGFPGETEEEFAETMAFAKKVGFYEIHIFKYSKRQGTVAAAMKDQIDESIKAERSDQLFELEREMARSYREAYLHKDTEVLFEEEKEIGGVRYQIGYNAQYIRGAIREDTDFTGEIRKGSFREFLDSDIMLFG